MNERERKQKPRTFSERSLKAGCSGAHLGLRFLEANSNFSDVDYSPGEADEVNKVIGRRDGVGVSGFLRTSVLGGESTKLN